MSAENDGYGVEDDEVEIERRRLGLLAEARDPKTIEQLERCGVQEGWRCLEVGAGAGTISAWLGERVGSTGSVLSTDIDLRFHIDVPDNVEVRVHDIVNDDLPGPFNLIHARAVLQHIPEREAVFARLIAALAPGGWLVVEDGTFKSFGEQPVPEPYGKIHRLMASAATTDWRDPELGLRLLDWFRNSELVDVDLEGDAWVMRHGEAGGDWWFLAVERAGPRLVEYGLITTDEFDAALAQIREPGFALMSSLSVSVRGRLPG